MSKPVGEHTQISRLLVLLDQNTLAAFSWIDVVYMDESVSSNNNETRHPLHPRIEDGSCYGY